MTPAALLLILAACLPPPVYDGTQGDTGNCPLVMWYQDADGDGHGDPNAVVLQCTADEGEVASGDDCDDSDPDVWQGVSAWQDSDGDGYGVSDVQALVCSADMQGWADQTGDCDDNDATVNPDATPVCGDGVDNDCNAQTDCDLPAGALDPGDANATLTGGAEDEFGASIALGRDLFGASEVDLVIGAPDTVSRSGRPGVVYAFAPFTGQDLSEAQGVALSGASDSDEAGGALLAPGDLDGDGLPDLVIGAAGGGDDHQGAVYVAFGPTTAARDLATDVDAAVLVGEVNSDRAGAAVVASADLTGGGAGDLVIGAYKADSSAGAIYVMPEPLSAGTASLTTAAATITGTVAGDKLGTALASLDMDGGGVADLVAGAPNASSGSGTVYLIPSGIAGAVDLADASPAPITSAETDARFGYALNVPGDVDGDGVDDLLVGAPSKEAADGSRDGRVMLYSGAALALLTGPTVATDAGLLATFESADGKQPLGLVFAGIGDLDDDGLADLALGVPDYPGAGGGAIEEGAVFLYYGGVANTVGLADANASVTGISAYTHVGAALCAMGDVNGLGVPDLMIGAPGGVDDEDEGIPGTALLFLADGY